MGDPPYSSDEHIRVSTIFFDHEAHEEHEDSLPDFRLSMLPFVYFVLFVVR
jgi:hypothetical protein